MDDGAARDRGGLAGRGNRVVIYVDFIPSAGTLLAYSTAAIVLIATPGPDMTLFLQRTLTNGRVAGLMSMAGTMVGLLVHTALAAAGLSALLAASPWAFQIVQIAGAIYLLWLAFNLLRHGSTLDLSAGDPDRASLTQVFAKGLAINLLNPKIVLFFATFLPQFVAANDPHAGSKLAFLGLWYVSLSLPICGTIIHIADEAAQRLGRSPQLLRAFDVLSAIVFVSFALRLIFARPI
jgi:threonine/homoserine/homoserine lactone efflux protein